jgi:hypothetical protein
MSRHQAEAQLNLERWKRKPVLREIYRGFHQQIAAQVSPGLRGEIIEIGSGIGSLRDVIPVCTRTDGYPSPFIDRVENAYALSCADRSVSHLILFDVFHHLKYPGTAMDEFRRVLVERGRLILFDPCISLFGLAVYGLAHPEPVGLFRPIVWRAPDGRLPGQQEYYAAQGNATRLFVRGRGAPWREAWSLVTMRRLSALSYVASGGYSGPQLYPARWLPWLRRVDKVLDRFPGLFATRLLVVLEKVEPLR